MKNLKGWGYSLVAEYLPNIHEALDLISNTTKRKKIIEYLLCTKYHSRHYDYSTEQERECRSGARLLGFKSQLSQL